MQTKSEYLAGLITDLGHLTNEIKYIARRNDDVFTKNDYYKVEAICNDCLESLILIFNSPIMEWYSLGIAYEPEDALTSAVN